MTAKHRGHLSNWAAGINILKAVVGLGVLALPRATAEIGWLACLLGMFIVAILSVGGIFVAVWAQQELAGTKHERAALVGPHGSTSHADNVSMDLGLGFFDGLTGRVFGPPGRWACVIFLTACQLATAVVYVDVVASTVENAFPGQNARLLIHVALFVLLSLLSIIRSLEGVAWLSALALAIYGFICSGLFLETAQQLSQGILGQSSRAVIASGDGFGTWFGTVSFAFGGFNIAVLVYDDMENPEDFIKVTNITFAVCGVFYATFAISGYLCFGDDVETMLYKNFQDGSIFERGSEWSIAVILLFSYILNMVPVHNLVETLLAELSCTARLHYTFLRATVVACTVVVAFALPDVLDVIDVTGAVFGAALSFVLPAMVYLRVAKYPAAWEFMLCAGLIGIGLAGALSTLFNVL